MQFCLLNGRTGPLAALEVLHGRLEYSQNPRCRKRDRELLEFNQLAFVPNLDKKGIWAWNSNGTRLAIQITESKSPWFEVAFTYRSNSFVVLTMRDRYRGLAISKGLIDQD